MIKKKSITLLILLFVTLFIYGCEKNQDKNTAESLLKSIYEVKDYKAFINVKEKHESMVIDGTGIKDIDEDVYMSYIEEYRPYTTQKGLEHLFSQGIATYMDDLAYSTEFYSSVDSVELEKIKTSSDNPEYQYTVNLMLTKEDKEEAGKIGGIIGFDKDEDGEYKVNFIKPNSSTASTIDEIIARLLK